VVQQAPSPVVIQQPSPAVVVQQPPPVVIPAPAPPVVQADPTRIPPGVIEDGVHYGYLTSSQGMVQLTFDRADVQPDGSWSNTNSKLRTLPTDPSVWMFSYPYSGQPIEVVVQNQHVTAVYAV
jgi:hypothetical protein